MIKSTLQIEHYIVSSSPYKPHLLVIYTVDCRCHGSPYEPIP